MDEHERILERDRDEALPTIFTLLNVSEEQKDLVRRVFGLGWCHGFATASKLEEEAVT